MQDGARRSLSLRQDALTLVLLQWIAEGFFSMPGEIERTHNHEEQQTGLIVRPIGRHANCRILSVPSRPAYTCEVEREDRSLSLEVRFTLNN